MDAPVSSTDINELVHSSSLLEHVEAYVQARHSGDDSLWDEKYKWEILPQVHQEFTTDGITTENVVEKVETLQRRNPPSGSFVHWSNLNDLKQLAEAHPKQVAEELTRLYDDGEPLHRRINRFREVLRAFREGVSLGTPLFGYLFAAHDYHRYPLYKDSTYLHARALLRKDDEWRSFSIGMKYEVFRELCLAVGRYLNERNLLEEITIDGVQVKPGIIALDGQDFLYHLEWARRHQTEALGINPQEMARILRAEEREGYQEPSFKEIFEAVSRQGLRISERALRRYHLALKTRGFVILSGISGSGKTWLAKAYADAVQAEYLLVPVAPNWTTNEDLLGYFNPIDGQYHDTPFSRFLRQAALEYEDAQAEGRTPRPYCVTLDEMNLARVEYYFAKFLSAMEVRVRSDATGIELAPGEHVLLPPSLYFVGTVNVDETTHGFADKVYDRAHLIELEAPREALSEHLGAIPYRDALMEVWDAVHDVAPFAFRVLDEIKAYVSSAEELGVSWEDALDEQLLQKILPKLKGADPRVGETLDRFIRLAAERFPLSHAKASQMLEGFRNHGFASFF